MSDEVNVNDSTVWNEYFDSATTETVAENTPAETADNAEEITQAETAEEVVEEQAKEEPVKDDKPAEKHKIKVGGEEIELTLEQLKARAQMGEDYTRKTQAVSDERKAVEAEKARVQAILAEIEASKTIKPQAPQQMQQPSTGIASNREAFKQQHGVDYEFYNEEHQDLMQALIEERAATKAEARFLQKLQGVQAQQDAAITQSELGELQRFAQTEPPEVVDFALKAIYSVAQTDPARFDLLYSAHRKIVQQQLQFVTPQEARALKEHAFSSRKAFYGSTEKAEVQKEMKTESSASPVRVENKVKATEIRQMHRADAESEFDRYMKGG